LQEQYTLLLIILRVTTFDPRGLLNNWPHVTCDPVPCAKPRGRGSGLVGVQAPTCLQDDSWDLHKSEGRPFSFGGHHTAEHSCIMIKRTTNYPALTTDDWLSSRWYPGVIVVMSGPNIHELTSEITLTL